MPHLFRQTGLSDAWNPFNSDQSILMEKSDQISHLYTSP